MLGRVQYVASVSLSDDVMTRQFATVRGTVLVRTPAGCETKWGAVLYRPISRKKR